jgi:PadR family transcriptional regulator PadR
MIMDNTKAQMRKGVLEMCILALLAEREMYTSELLERLKDAELIVVEGTLYPLLNRLKDAGLVTYQWKESPSGPPRKYFRITEEGDQNLSQLRSNWEQLVQSVSTTLKNPVT